MPNTNPVSFLLGEGAITAIDMHNVECEFDTETGPEILLLLQPAGFYETYETAQREQKQWRVRVIAELETE